MYFMVYVIYYKQYYFIILFVLFVLTWFKFHLFVFNKYHFSFVYFVSCICIQVDAYIFMYGLFMKVCALVLIYLWFCAHTYKHV